MKVAKKFTAFMEEHANLRTIVEEGKGKLQWERDIPAAALSNLESLASTDFKANLGKIIHDIYQVRKEEKVFGNHEIVEKEKSLRNKLF